LRVGATLIALSDFFLQQPPRRSGDRALTGSQNRSNALTPL
jgi:hypothetical protein